MKTYPYNFLTSVYTTSQKVVVHETCNGFTAVNQGVTDAIVNGIELKAGTATSSGESISLGGDVGEIFKGRIDIYFPATTGRVLIIQKIYLPGNE